MGADCCCYEYYCECNKNKCYDLGECTCPPGFVRQIVDTDACCPIARCCQTTTVTSTKTTSYTTRTVTHTTPTTHIKATPRECATQPKCASDEFAQEYQIDECCCGYKCIPQDCKKVECTEPVPCCSYCEDLCFHQIDDCCCTYTCECNTSKCIDLGDCPCPC